MEGHRATRKGCSGRMPEGPYTAATARRGARRSRAPFWSSRSGVPREANSRAHSSQAPPHPRGMTRAWRFWGDAMHDAQADMPSAGWLRAQLAFKDSMVHRILQFTPSIVFRYVLHRCESRDIRCRESLSFRTRLHSPLGGRRASPVSDPWRLPRRDFTLYDRDGKGDEAPPPSRRPGDPGRFGAAGSRVVLLCRFRQ
ncbi:hypothetical protein CRG98_000752 [Punica granatum]|uniref:Uncharacterized protein n=1 Tax=Punica granatum TaxID=22663 RepID=A0A2I0LDY4_PUNGR|nr:hypothetical protein CRG98_000752 [Punica granatum]